jgi:hypothetical protein
VTLPISPSPNCPTHTTHRTSDDLPLLHHRRPDLYPLHPRIRPRPRDTRSRPTGVRPRHPLVSMQRRRRRRSLAGLMSVPEEEPIESVRCVGVVGRGGRWRYDLWHPRWGGQSCETRRGDDYEDGFAEASHGQTLWRQLVETPFLCSLVLFPRSSIHYASKHPDSPSVGV